MGQLLESRLWLLGELHLTPINVPIERASAWKLKGFGLIEKAGKRSKETEHLNGLSHHLLTV